MSSSVSSPERVRHGLWRRVLALALGVLLPLCGTAAAPAGTGGAAATGAEDAAGAGARAGGAPPDDRAQVHTLTHQDRERSYVLHVPPQRPAPAPLVVLLHGGGGSGAAFLASSGMVPMAEREGFVIVAPDAIRGLWNAGSCCTPPDIDDVGFLRKVVADVQGRVAIDPRRIFAAGHSNGGFMAYRVACDMSETFAAVAASAGYLLDVDAGTREEPLDPPRPVFTCSPRAPVAVLHVHGLADTCAPFAGGPVTCGGPRRRPPVAHGIDAFLRFNACTGSPTETFANGRARCVSHAPCAAGTDVTLCTVEEGGHAWYGSGRQPSASRFGGSGTDDIRTAEAAWQFFAAHPRAGD
jgi:polyhydroxybutyrate depolymerase